jgi:O-antigen/teichoic acid export membrane protein
MNRTPVKQYVASLALLAGGSGIAQLIPLAVAPILTRIYPPSAFAALALLTALGSIWAAVASGRLHMAILIPPSDDEARRVLSLSILITFASSLFLLSILLIAELSTPGPALVSLLGNWLMAVPLFGALLCYHEALTNAAIRCDLMAPIAKSTVTRAVMSSGGQVGLGALSVHAGLLIGSAIGSISGNARIYDSVKRALPRARLIGHSRRLLHRYVRFIYLDTPGALLNALATNAAILGIASLYNSEELGQYALAFRVLVLPSAVIGTAIGQIFAQRIAATLRTPGPTSSVREYHRTTALLATISVVCFTPLMAAGPLIFSFAFGDTWEHAGRIAAVLAPLLIVRFVASPLTCVLSIYERQGTLLMIQTLLAVSAGGVLLAALAFEWELLDMLRAQTVISAAIYTGSWLVGRRLLMRQKGDAK